MKCFESLIRCQNTEELIRRISFGEKLIITDSGYKTFGRKNKVTLGILEVWCKSNDSKPVWCKTHIKTKTKVEKELFNDYLDCEEAGYSYVCVGYDDQLKKLFTYSDVDLILELSIFLDGTLCQEVNKEQ
ncbi:MAG: hypothetical protein AB4368_23545 [Xenococcaceae cyanobacterium]